MLFAAVLLFLFIQQGYGLSEIIGFIEYLRQEKPLFAGLLTIAGFWLGIFLFITVPVMIVSAAALHGPLLGILYSTAGLISGAAFFYALGRTLHCSTWLERYAAVRKIKAKFALIQSYGIWAVTFTRMIPSGPFSLVNLVTGMLGFSQSQFVGGTLIGLAPAILAFSSFGNVLVTALADPHGENIRILIILGCLYAVFMGGLIFTARRFFANRR